MKITTTQVEKVISAKHLIELSEEEARNLRAELLIVGVAKHKELHKLYDILSARA